MQLTDTITPAMIASAEAADACQLALDWLREQPRTLGDLVEERPQWALWAVGRGLLELPQGIIDDAARARPVTALCFVAGRLSPELFRRLTCRMPHTALRYAAAHLPPHLLVELARRMPVTALRYAAAHLLEELLAALARGMPRTALRFAAAHLPPELLAELARRRPQTAMRYASLYLPPALLAELETP